MKRTMLPILIILVMTAYTPAALAALAGSTVLSVSLSNYDPNPAIAGDNLDVRIGIENIGGTDITNLIMEVVPAYPFELVQGENAVQDVGIVEGYQVDSTANLKIVQYTMKVNRDAPAGNYELKLKYYEQGSTDMTQKSLYINVKSRQTAEVIHIDKSTLVPGKESGLKFTINNVGNAPLRDLTFYWENTDNIILPVGSDNTRYIRYIEVGNGTELDYQVIADTNAQPGLYKLNLYLSYEDSISNKTNKISTIAGVYVGGGTDFEVAFSDNANSQTSFSIANIGSNPASSVSVIIPNQQGWRVSGTSSVIIGNLNKGDYTVASFNLQSATSNMTSQNMDFQNNLQNRSGRGNTSYQGRSPQRSMNGSPNAVLMQIAYTDTMGERKIVEKQVNVGSSNTASADGLTAIQGRRGAASQDSVFSGYALYIIGILVLAGIFLGYRKYKTCKLMDPDFKIKDLLKRGKK
jgi:hypothetical protein